MPGGFTGSWSEFRGAMELARESMEAAQAVLVSGVGGPERIEAARSVDDAEVEDLLVMLGQLEAFARDELPGLVQCGQRLIAEIRKLS